MTDIPYRPLDYLDHSSISPSGHISARARKAATARLSAQLWPGGCTREDITGGDKPNPMSKADMLRKRAGELRGLADRGMCVRKYRRKADEMDKRADEMETESVE